MHILSLSLYSIVIFLTIYSSFVKAGSPPPANTASILPKASCVDYQNVLLDGTNGFCAGLINYKYYLPDGYSQEVLERTAYEQLYANPSAAPLLSLLPPRCGAQLKKTICASVFMKCSMVDPYFLDSSCNLALGQTCQTDTGASVCKDLSNTIVSTGCIVGPGKVFGYGDVGYEVAAAATTPTPVPVQALCAANNMTWSDDAKSCLAPIPISPSKSICDELHSADTTIVTDAYGTHLKAVCPVVSGMFFDLILNLMGTSNTSISLGIKEVKDPFVRNELNNTLAAQGCDTNPNNLACYSKPFNVNFLSVFGILPSCDATLPQSTDMYAFSQTYIQETKSSNRLQSLGALIAGKSTLQTGANCQVTGATAAANNCTTLLASVQPNTGSTVILQPSVAFASDLDDDKTVAKDGTTTRMNDQCIKIITDDKNQPSDADLSIIAAAAGRSNVNDAKGAFFVPASLGLPPLPHIFGFKGSDASSPYARFMTQKDEPAGSSPLCSLNGGKIRGKNSLECLLNQVNSAINILPKWVNPKCRTALMEVACSSGHLKPEVKRMCLVPTELGGCASSDVAAKISGQPKFPFVFALPRFASKATCTKAKEECKPFISYLQASDPASAGAIEAALNCDQEIDISCDDNSEWRSSVWPESKACKSAFNGLKMFPESASAIGSLGSLGAFLDVYSLGLQQKGLHVGSFSSLLTTEPTKQVYANLTNQELLSYCECPRPLKPRTTLPPVNDTTEFLCCTDVCTTSMFPPETFQYYYNLQFYISFPSLICSGFLFVTFLTFKAKRQQRITVYFSMTSMIIGLMFIITNSKPKHTDLYCKDEVTPIQQSDGGMCIFQAFLLTFFTVAACGWWFCQSLDLLLKVVLNKRVEYLPLYHLISWGVPSIATIIYASTNTFGYTGPNPWCFSSVKGIPNLEYYLFYGPIVFYTLFGFLMMCAVIGKIFLVTSAGQAVTQTKQSTMKRLQTFRTPILFVFFFLFVFLIIFSWRFQITSQESKVKGAATKWIGCLLTNFANGINDPATDASANITLIKDYIQPGAGCGLNYPLKIDLNMLTLITVVALLQGLYVFAIFGAKMETIHLWAERLHLTSHRYDTTEDKTSQKGKGNTGTAKTSMLMVQKNVGSAADKTNYRDGQVISTGDE